jgi:hypothetical protein
VLLKLNTPALRAYTAAGVKDLGLSFLNTSHGLPQAAVRKVAEFLIKPAKVSQVHNCP